MKGLVAAVICAVLAFSGFVYWIDARNERQADEKFHNAFGSERPRSAEARRVLRPIILQKLVQVRSELEQTRQHHTQLRTLLDDRPARNVEGATRDLRLIEDRDASLQRTWGLEAFLDTICRIAAKERFSVETEAAQCRYKSYGGGGFLD